MEALYAKLYDKYTKLKKRKWSELDKLNKDQEVKFVTYVNAAEELIQHLKNENDQLRAQVDDLRSEVSSIRSAKDDQLTEFQNRLMEESQKSKAYGFGYLVLLVTLILAYQFGVLASTSWIQYVSA